MTWSLQSNAAGKTGIQINDHKSNPSAHTKEDKKRERERGAENKKSCPELICYIV